MRDKARAALVTRQSVGKRERRLHILLAEDNPVNRKLAVRMLEKHGHSVVVAENGRKALMALAKKPFDLVLLDVQMPEMGGFEATAAIREKEKHSGKHIPIVAMTAHVMKGDRERCLEAGMDGYLAKPIQARKLFETIEGLAPAPARAKRSQSERLYGLEAFDEAALLAQVDGDFTVLKELIRIFLADCPKMLSEIRRAIARRDKEALRTAAHAFKGSVANFAATDALEAALKLETRGRNGDLAGAEVDYAALKIEIARLRRALAALREEARRKTSKRGQSAKGLRDRGRAARRRARRASRGRAQGAPGR